MKQRKDRRALTRARARLYGDYNPQDIGTRIRTLRRFDEDRRTFARIGGRLTVEATERAWVRSAVLLAAEPAKDALEARARAEYLLAAVDGWVLLSPRMDAHLPSIGMIMAAIHRDEAYWGFATTNAGRAH